MDNHFDLGFKYSGSVCTKYVSFLQIFLYCFQVDVNKRSFLKYQLLELEIDDSYSFFKSCDIHRLMLLVTYSLRWMLSSLNKHKSTKEPRKLKKN